MVKKAVVVHAEARDRYELSRALYEKNRLAALVTDYYSNDLLYKLIPGSAGKRHNEGLPAQATRSSFKALFLSLQMRFKNAFQINLEKDMYLSKKAYKTAKSMNAHLFCYSYYAYHAFKKAEAEIDMKKLLFQLHPHPLSVKKLLLEELQLVPHASGSLMYENELKYPERYLEDLSNESSLADAIVVASNYTKNTLVENGIREAKIEVVPYGTDLEKFNRRNLPPSNNNLRVIYVGSMVQRKGISYLLEAIKKFPSEQVELVLCGRGYIDQTLLQYYSDVKFAVKTGLSQRELLHELHQSNVFCLPSLCEGFAHVILEAMASGLPVISTSNTCAPDIMQDGKHGFIVPIRSSEALAAKFEWCIQNKDSLFNMGQDASAKAQHYTWEAFRHSINSFYKRSVG